jgi:hypothetical protein
MAAYPVMMGLALVYTAEHYVIDVVLGVVYAYIVDRLCTIWETRHPPREEQRRRPASAARRTESIDSHVPVGSGASAVYRAIIEADP